MLYSQAEQLKLHQPVPVTLHPAAVRTAFKERLAATTTNKMLVALRRVLTEAYRLDLMDANDFHKAIDLPNVKGTGKLRGRALSTSEIEALIDSCYEQRNALGFRDAAAIACSQLA